MYLNTVFPPEGGTRGSEALSESDGCLLPSRREINGVIIESITALFWPLS